MEPGSRPRRPISGALPEFIREWPTIADGLNRNAGCKYMGQNATAARSERFLGQSTQSTRWIVHACTSDGHTPLPPPNQPNG